MVLVDCVVLVYSVGCSNGSMFVLRVLVGSSVLSWWFYWSCVVLVCCVVLVECWWFCVVLVECWWFCVVLMVLCGSTGSVWY